MLNLMSIVYVACVYMSHQQLRPYGGGGLGFMLIPKTAGAQYTGIQFQIPLCHQNTYIKLISKNLCPLKVWKHSDYNKIKTRTRNALNLGQSIIITCITFQNKSHLVYLFQ